MQVRPWLLCSEGRTLAPLQTRRRCQRPWRLSVCKYDFLKTRAIQRVRVGGLICWCVIASNCKEAHLMTTYPRHRPDLQNWFAVACETGCVETVRLLLPAVDPTTNGGLLLASNNGHVAVVKALLADGRVDPRENECEALWYPCFHGHVAVVEALLSDGRADPAASDSRGFWWASMRGHLAVVQALLADGRANPRANHNAAIRLASAHGHVRVVRLLLANHCADRDAGMQCSREHKEAGPARAHATYSAWFGAAEISL